jgi:class 3 adenylate cyclase
MFEMLDLVYRLIDRVVVAAGGRVVKYMGDAALVVFPEDCARAAVAALQTLKTQTAGLWADFGIECTVRTKAHLGPVACGPLGPEGRFDVIGGAVNELFVMPWGGSEVSADLQAAIPRT